LSNTAASAELIVIDQVLIAEREPEDALAQEVAER
jgi:hypothetical protein